jgi:probable HAF family extracellular repeat protein
MKKTYALLSTRILSRLTTAAATVLLAVGLGNSAPAQSLPQCTITPKKYTVTPLPLTSGTAISLPGKVVGTGLNSVGTQHAFSYFNGTVTDLGAFAGTGVDPSLEPSEANAVSVTGLVVGDSTNPGLYTHAASFWSGTVKDLGTLGGFNSSATGVNFSGTIVGISDLSTEDLGIEHAFVKTSSGLKDLGTLGGTGNSEAFAINDLGEIVGQSVTANGDTHAFLYKKGKLIDLGTLGGSVSAALAINDEEAAVGYAALSGDANVHAVAYFHGHAFDLGVLSDGDSAANSINDLFQAVGTSGLNSPTNDIRAVLFTSGKVIDLNTLIDSTLGIFLTNATSINDKGQIVAQGTDVDGNFATYLLSQAKK